MSAWYYIALANINMLLSAYHRKDFNGEKNKHCKGINLYFFSFFLSCYKTRKTIAEDSTMTTQPVYSDKHGAQ